MLRQGADAQLHRSQFVEMLDELVRSDADEARCEAALRHERGGCAIGDRADLLGDRNVFGQVEVMQALGPRHFRHGDVAEIGQARYQCGRLVFAHVRGERFLVARIEVEGGERVQPVGCGDRFCEARLGVCELHPVAAAFGQQAGYEGADLAGAEYEDLFHGGS